MTKRYLMSWFRSSLTYFEYFSCLKRQYLHLLQQFMAVNEWSFVVLCSEFQHVSQIILMIFMETNEPWLSGTVNAFRTTNCFWEWLAKKLKHKIEKKTLSLVHFLVPSTQTQNNILKEKSYTKPTYYPKLSGRRPYSGREQGLSETSSRQRAL